MFSEWIGVFDTVNTFVVFHSKIKSEILREERNANISFVESDDKQTTVFKY